MLHRLLPCFVSFLGAATLAAPKASADEYRISGPYTHDNLSVFLIHSAARRAGAKLLTLQEALEQKKVLVYETGSVNELAIENLSSEDVYIQSGDIVKGGWQDRVFPDDVVLPSHSGKVPISSFCVEHGRWSQRGGEAAGRFNASTQALPMKPLKLAARGQGGQTQVWSEVAKAQHRLAMSVAATAPLAPASPTSMQLALENKQVSEATAAYIRDLKRIIDGKTDIIGYAFAVNGKINSAEIYASADLFQRMWPKLLKASAAEALAERPTTSATAPPVSAASVRTALTDADRGRESSKDITNRVRLVTKESQQVMLFETRDRASGGAWLHRSYIIK